MASQQTNGQTTGYWQGRLQDHCRAAQLRPPVFNIVSDRRGGRTAWSSSVCVEGQGYIAARYWYDGEHVHQAKEDAAELALQRLSQANQTPTTQTYYTA
ncbi:hypothetical protein M501DRAFT_1019265 [Patellaria atrata CBS 101060]|uniref:DRBM domain-containing protein n=1 Tax=Patellaria atrata CBS 101060 TaxID=1346257 RepID=A0A9P4VNT8_9PEZI|nr:hypothetical protein M501DRAFT_1019265 [Patellaria atrata CBS 101060]